MRNEIKKLEEKYNIELNIERERTDAFDNRSRYITKVWKIINEQVICITYTIFSNTEEKINELEAQIKKALNN